MSADMPTPTSPGSSSAGRLPQEQIEQALMESVEPELDSTFVETFERRFEAKWGPLNLTTLLQVAHNYAPTSLHSNLPPPAEALSLTPASEPPMPTHVPIAANAPFLVEPEVTPDALFVLVTVGVVLTQRASNDEITAQGRDLLARYLASPHPRERWASALWLGRLRDERAMPVLVQMLTEYLPPHVLHYPDGSSGMFWYDSWRAKVPPLLCQLSGARLAAALRQALRAALAVEQVIPRPSGSEEILQVNQERLTGQEAWEWYATDCRPWLAYQHQLVYALGRVGAFGALLGIPTPAGYYDAWGTWLPAVPDEDSGPAATAAHAARFRGDLWRVEASGGFLEPGYSEQVGEECRRRHGAGIHRFSTVPNFAQAVERLLEERFGLTEEERCQAMRDYERADFLSRTTRYYEHVMREARAVNR